MHLNNVIVVLVSLIALLVVGGRATVTNVLIVSPSLSKSIVHATGRIADILAERHNVTFWILDMNPRNSDTNATRRAHVLRMERIENRFAEMMESDFEYLAEADRPMEGPTLWRILGDGSTMRTRFLEGDAITGFCESILKRANELEPLRGRFDVALTDMVDLCSVGLVHHLRIPSHIWISTGPLLDIYYHTLGIPQPLAHVPSPIDNFVGPRMNFWQRVNNLKLYTITWLANQYYYIGKENALFRRHIGEEFPRLERLAAASTLCLTFSGADPLLHDAPYPVDRRLIGIGGLGMEDRTERGGAVAEEELDETFRRVASLGRDGFALFSLGTATPTHRIGMERRAELFAALADVEELHFIVKISREDEWSRHLAHNLSNVDVVEWLPQVQLLAHPRVRLFISHVGLNSLAEAVTYGVPLVTLPLFFDQFYNAAVGEWRGVATAHPLTAGLNRHSLAATIRQAAAANSSHACASAKWSRWVAERPVRADARLRHAVDFALSTTAAKRSAVFLTPKAVALSFDAYFHLDLALVLFGILWFLSKK